MIFTYDPNDPRLGHVIVAFNNNIDSQTIEVTPATPLPVVVSGSLTDPAVVNLLTEISAKLTQILSRLPLNEEE